MRERKFPFIHLCQLVMLLVLVVLTGCAPQAQIDMLDRDVAGLQVETHRIDEEVQGLKRQLSEIQGQADQSSRKSIARLNARIDSLESELMRLNGLVDQLKYNQEREESELAQLKEEIQRVMQSGAKTTAPAVVAAQSSSGAQIAPEVNGTGNSQEPQKKIDLYDEGLRLFRLGKYLEAKQAFRDFIKENPNSPKVANAHFWIGECEYKQSRYEEAILEYNKVIKKYPRSNKVPDALLKQAFAFAKLGDKDSAKILLQKLVKSYPRSAQAKVAKRQLKLLK
ncbi:MAG: tol-pal system protein YbgF [Thermodesulfobacteria bacterium]|nr:tol-pal system protein YbgF [Thermodesulfobacteriota bacterium]